MVPGEHILRKVTHRQKAQKEVDLILAWVKLHVLALSTVHILYVEN